MNYFSKILFFLGFNIAIFGNVCTYLPTAKKCFDCCSEMKKNISFSLLCFQPKLEGLDYGITNTSQTRELNGDIEYPKFSWSAGGKVKFSYISDFEIGIDGSFYFINQSDREKQNVIDQTDINDPYNGQGLIPIWTHPRTYAGYLQDVRFENAKAKTEINYYTLNLMVAKSFCISKRISIKPQFGLGDLFFYNDFDIYYENGKTFPTAPGEIITPQNAYSKNTQKTYAFGPRAGINTLWYFNNYCNFFANLNASLLYTYFYNYRNDKNDYFKTSDGDTFDKINVKNNQKSIKPFVEFLLGISFEKCLKRNNHNNIFIRYSLAYETHIFWKMNQMIRFLDDVNDGSIFSSKGDFSLQGINISVECHF